MRSWHAAGLAFRWSFAPKCKLPSAGHAPPKNVVATIGEAMSSHVVRGKLTPRLPGKSLRSAALLPHEEIVCMEIRIHLYIPASQHSAQPLANGPRMHSDGCPHNAPGLPPDALETKATRSEDAIAWHGNV